MNIYIILYLEKIMIEKFLLIYLLYNIEIYYLIIVILFNFISSMIQLIKILYITENN